MSSKYCIAIFICLYFVCGCSSDNDFDETPIEGQDSAVSTIIKYYQALANKDECAFKECWWQTPAYLELAECEYDYYIAIDKFRGAIESKFGENSWIDYTEIETGGYYLDFAPIDDLNRWLKSNKVESHEFVKSWKCLFFSENEFEIVNYKGKYFLRFIDEIHNRNVIDTVEASVAMGKGIIEGIDTLILAMESDGRALPNYQNILLPDVWDRIVYLDGKEMTLAELKELSQILYIIKTKPTLDKYFK